MDCDSMGAAKFKIVQVFPSRSLHLHIPSRPLPGYFHLDSIITGIIMTLVLELMTWS